MSSLTRLLPLSAAILIAAGAAFALGLQWQSERLVNELVVGVELDERIVLRQIQLEAAAALREMRLRQALQDARDARIMERDREHVRIHEARRRALYASFARERKRERRERAERRDARFPRYWRSPESLWRSY